MKWQKCKSIYYHKHCFANKYFNQFKNELNKCLTFKRRVKLACSEIFKGIYHSKIYPYTFETIA